MSHAASKSGGFSWRIHSYRLKSAAGKFGGVSLPRGGQRHQGRPIGGHSGDLAASTSNIGRSPTRSAAQGLLALAPCLFIDQCESPGIGWATRPTPLTEGAQNRGELGSQADPAPMARRCRAEECAAPKKVGHGFCLGRPPSTFGWPRPRGCKPDAAMGYYAAASAQRTRSRPVARTHATSATKGAWHIPDMNACDEVRELHADVVRVFERIRPPPRVLNCERARLRTTPAPPRSDGTHSSS